MAIDWTPWFNVPLHRRLELFSCALLNSCGIFMPTVILFTSIYIIVSRKQNSVEPGISIWNTL